jgi:hypothetical protein
MVTYKSLAKTVREGIDADYLVGSSADAFRYVVKHAKSGRYPSKNEVQDNFGVELPSVGEDDLPHLCDMLVKRKVALLIRPAIDEARTCVESRDLDGALRIFREAQQHRHLLRTGHRVHSFKDDGDVRFASYVERATGTGALQTMWPTFNDACGGFEEGTLYVNAGLTETGKSWTIAIHADFLSYLIPKEENILIVTTEMGVDRFVRRIDCVKYEIPFRLLRDGCLETADEEAWVEAIEQAMDHNVDFCDIKVVAKDQARTVEDIVLLCEDIEPSMVFIDGGYRLEAKGKDNWSRQVNIIEGLQDAVLTTKLPWYVTTQLNRDKKDGAKGAGVRYAQEWLINPDVVVKMEQSEDQETANLMEHTFVKLREGEQRGISFLTNWDKVEYDYSEVLEEDDD